MQVITIAYNGRSLTIGQYVAIIKRVKASAPGTQFPNSFCGWWHASREEILRQFARMVEDKINEHLEIRCPTESRLYAKIRLKLKSYCRWCGQSLGRYEPDYRRFCDMECRRSYNS